MVNDAAESDNDFMSRSPFPLTAIDRHLLSMRDEDFDRTEWNDLKRIIANNTLEDLKRLPSDLRRYMKWSEETKLTYGSITNFIVEDRLRWKPSHQVTTDQPVTATSFAHHSKVPFQDRRDYTVLINDWPYGFVPEITHLVVWSRTPIAVDDRVGDVTNESRVLIAAFVRQYFAEALTAVPSNAELNVLWFKNWSSLQSVRGIDHIHVLVRSATSDQIQRWTANNPSDYGHT